MKNRHIIYCIIILLVSLTASCKKNDVSGKDKKFILYNIEGNDTLGILGTYDYPPTIAESCRDVFFSDSMLRAISKKVLNNPNIYLRDSDFDTGFYIIEEFYHAAHYGIRFYLIVTRENKLMSYEFEFVNSYSSFFLVNIDTVNKEKFKNFYESFKKQDSNEGTMTYRGFNVT